MNAGTCAALVFLCNKLGCDIAFDGNTLVHAIGHCIILNSLIEEKDGTINERKRLFWNKYEQKGMSKQSCCFYV